MPLIIVGVDDSVGAKAAVRFAVEEARFRSATLRAVHAWHWDHVGVEGPYPAGHLELADARAVAETLLYAAVGEELVDGDATEIEHRVVEGSPAAVLIGESRHADLLVVGSRGRGGFAQLLLGSVSNQCAQHAECPVVIVRSKGAG